MSFADALVPFVPLPHGALALEEPLRCRGVTRTGAPCRWNAAHSGVVAAPLRVGRGYCHWHLHQENQKSDGLQQQKLDAFFHRGSSSCSVDPVPLPDRSLSPTQPCRLELTEDQIARINDNRRKALERRQLRLSSQDNVDSSDPSAPGSLHAPSPAGQENKQEVKKDAAVQLTQSQLDRIAKNRQEALEKRRQKQQQDAMLASALMTRSRTPPRRPRRLLVASVTASPVAAPGSGGHHRAFFVGPVGKD